IAPKAGRADRKPPSRGAGQGRLDLALRLDDAGENRVDPHAECVGAFMVAAGSCRATRKADGRNVLWHWIPSGVGPRRKFTGIPARLGCDMMPHAAMLGRTL